MLGEVITKAKAAGACTILIGVILTISGTPATDNDDDASGEDGLLTPSNVAALAQRPVGYIGHSTLHFCDEYFSAIILCSLIHPTSSKPFVRVVLVLSQRCLLRAPVLHCLGFRVGHQMVRERIPVVGKRQQRKRNQVGKPRGQSS